MMIGYGTVSVFLHAYLKISGIVGSDCNAVASRQQEESRSFEISTTFLSSFIKATKRTDVEKLKKNDPETVLKVANRILRRCVRKDQKVVELYTQASDAVDDVGQIKALIKELYKVKAKAIFATVHKDADRDTIYRTLVLLYHFVWSISDKCQLNDERSYANSLSGVFRPPEDELVDKEVTLGTLFFPWVFGAYSVDKKTSDSIINILELISYEKPSQDRIVNCFENIARESDFYIGFYKGKCSSFWSSCKFIVKEVTEYLKNAEGGKVEVEKRFGVDIAEDGVKKRAINKELSAAIRIIELFRALDFKSYTDDSSYDKIDCTLGKTFLDDKIEASIHFDKESTDKANVTNICPYFVYNREITFCTPYINRHNIVTEAALASLRACGLFESVKFRGFIIHDNPEASANVLRYIGKNKLKTKVELIWDHTFTSLDQLMNIGDEAKQGFENAGVELSLFIRGDWEPGSVPDASGPIKPFETLEEATDYTDRLIAKIPCGVKLNILSFHVTVEAMQAARMLLFKKTLTEESIEAEKQALEKALCVSKLYCARLGEAGVRSLNMDIYTWMGKEYLNLYFEEGKSADEGYSFYFMDRPKKSVLYMDFVLSAKDAKNIFDSGTNERLVFCGVTFGDDFIETFGSMKVEKNSKIRFLKVICNHGKEGKGANWIDGDFKKMILRVATELDNQFTSMTMCTQCTKANDVMSRYTDPNEVD